MRVMRALERMKAKYPKARRLLRPIVSLFRTRTMRRLEVQQSVLNRLATLLAEDPAIRVAEFCGEFRVGARSDLFRRIVISGKYEPELVERVRRLVDPDRDAIDVGANVGFYTVLLAKSLNGDARVLAVEPTSASLSRLGENVKRNRVGHKVVIFRGVAAESVGISTINVVPGREEYSSIGTLSHPAVDGGNFLKTEVVASTIDELVSNYGLSPGFIKIDVEGGERSVLLGAVKTLKAHRPVILAELSNPLLLAQGTSSAEVVMMIETLGYRVIDAIDDRLPPGIREYGEILGIPVE